MFCSAVVSGNVRALEDVGLEDGDMVMILYEQRSRVNRNDTFGNGNYRRQLVRQQWMTLVRRRRFA